MGPSTSLAQSKFGLFLCRRYCSKFRPWAPTTDLFLISLFRTLAWHLWLSATPVFLRTNILILDFSDHLDQINTPANQSWELALFTTPLSQVDPNTNYVSFLPNGSVDTTATSDQSFVVEVLLGAQEALLARTNVTVDILKFVNWIFVSIYWTMLFDLGQTSPKIYQYGGDPTLPDDPISFPTTNNIFINPSLFEIYYSYLNNTVLPILAGTNNLTAADIDIPWFDSPSALNHLNDSTTTFIRDFSCKARQFKKPLEALVQVILADYALIHFPLGIAVWFAVAIQKGVRRRDCGSLL
jgi:hypothetical protein